MRATTLHRMFGSAFTTGFVLSATLIIAIGAQNAFVLRQGIRREHVAPIVVFCALADLLLIGAGVAGLAGILGDSPVLVALLTLAGSAFLVWYGVRALARALVPQSLQTAAGSERLSLGGAMAQAAGFTLLNPHVYLDTVLLMGSIGTRQPPDSRVWFVGGAACASGLWFTTLGFGARLLAPVFARPFAWRVLDTLVGLTMLTLAVVLIRQGLGGLLLR
jgi:L-lysine exporter family protein LysE/ArgO